MKAEAPGREVSSEAVATLCSPEICRADKTSVFGSWFQTAFSSREMVWGILYKDVRRWLVLWKAFL